MKDMFASTVKQEIQAHAQMHVLQEDWHDIVGASGGENSIQRYAEQQMEKAIGRLRAGARAKVDKVLNRAGDMKERVAAVVQEAGTDLKAMASRIGSGGSDDSPHAITGRVNRLERVQGNFK